MNSPMEIVERKGIGHPDTVCDIVSDLTMSAYSEALGKKLGGVPNGSFDKVAVAGGVAILGFNACEVVTPPTYYLLGKAMEVDGSTDYMEPIFRGSVDHAVKTIFGLEVLEGYRPNITVDVNSGIGAEHDADFYKAGRKSLNSLWDYRLSNDTVACSGWYPFTKHERLTVTLENFINGEEFKGAFPETGTDVKILTRYIDNETYLTICIPFIAKATPSELFYTAKKREIESVISNYVNERVGKATIALNTKDIPGKGYLTVYGSAMDKGDRGMTGRGNRYPGLISVTRPSGVEAYSGKNPNNHSGRIYTKLAFDIARAIFEETGVAGCVFITADNGAKLTEPSSVRVIQNGKDVTAQHKESIHQQLESNLNERTVINVFSDYRTCYGLMQE